MSMQLVCVGNPEVIVPPSDIDKLKAETAEIIRLLQDVKAGTTNEHTFENLKVAVLAINEIILSLDNSNDFFKIGGFSLLLPLLSCENADVIAATAELIADLCQNNTFCQSKTLDFNILPTLVELLKNHRDSKVRSKALYAISSLCRHNKDSVKCLEFTGFVPVIMRVLEESDEKLIARAAFFLSHLANYENFREAFFKEDLIGILIKLLKGDDNLSTEHLLSTLKVQVTKHSQSKMQCLGADYNLKEILFGKLKMYDAKDEYQEAKEHCSDILAFCFPE